MRDRRQPFFAIAAIAIAIIGFVIAKEREKENRIEVGKVNWGRDLDAALEASAKSGKPLFVLFQEVPG